MTMFSGFLKSPQGLPAPRSIPNGGLGGLVSLRGRDKGKDTNNRTIGSTENTNRKKPAPISLPDAEVPVPAQTAPITQVEDWLLRTQEPPRTALAAFYNIDEADGEVQGLDSRPFWQRTGPEYISISIGNEAPQLQPIELPGSILLPDQGYGSESCYSPPLISRVRAFSDTSQLTFVPTSFSPMSPHFSEADGFTAVFRPINRKTSEFTRQVPSANMSAIATSTLVEHFPVNETRTREINTMSAHELLHTMCKFSSKEIVDEWIPAMEKEFAKLRAVIQILHSIMPLEDKLIKSFSQDMKCLVSQAREIATSHEQDFKKAQAEIDTNRRTDLEKLMDAEIRLNGAISSYNSRVQGKLEQDVEYARLQESLYHANITVTGFVRNNLAHILYNTDEGLTKEVVSEISTFERGKEESYREILSTISMPQDYKATRQALVEAQQRCKDAEDLVRIQQKIEQDVSIQLERALKRLDSRELEVQQIEMEFTNLKLELETEKRKNEAHRKEAAGEGAEGVDGSFAISNEDFLQRTSAELEREIDAILNSYSDGTIDYESAIFHQQRTIRELTSQNEALRNSIWIARRSSLSSSSHD